VRPTPDFFIAGAPKCGTTSLWNCTAAPQPGRGREAAPARGVSRGTRGIFFRRCRGTRTVARSGAVVVTASGCAVCYARAQLKERERVAP
jgi:hypothetical protein